MQTFKNIQKVLLSCLILVGLTLSLDVTAPITTNNPIGIELVWSQSKTENGVFKIHQIASLNAQTQFKRSIDYDYLIENEKRLNYSRFCIQSQSVLRYKSSLLKIVLNDISIVKSHCI
ncbi:hypothetical protein L3X39_05035 [Sabulilitoribacter multivorans]|uniref:Uncharacterized protein n=1 Tax=Flaviramulus multivorans TaxID=1304750 RepID=A0ABS9IGY8_9FLAO|nr:hypothetical protein [Flaviramulus multivorans]MCF7559994.1 hypothetical protein [Flaviramulus multivorans]